MSITTDDIRSLREKLAAARPTTQWDARGGHLTNGRESVAFFVGDHADAHAVLAAAAVHYLPALLDMIEEPSR